MENGPRPGDKLSLNRLIFAITPGKKEYDCFWDKVDLENPTSPSLKTGKWTGFTFLCDMRDEEDEFVEWDRQPIRQSFYTSNSE